jgi:hypothetical protein
MILERKKVSINWVSKDDGFYKDDVDDDEDR